MRVVCATVLLIALSLASACVPRNPPRVPSSPPPAAQVAPPTAIPMTRPAATITRAPAPTPEQRNTREPALAPTPTTAPASSPVIIAEWHTQSRDCWSSAACVSYALEIENPGSTPLIADYRLRVRVMNDAPPSRENQSLRDADEIVTEWDWVPLTAPRGRTAVAGVEDLPAAGMGAQTVTIEIVLSDRSTDFEASFPPAQSVSIFKAERGYAATAILKNPWKETLTDVRMVALAFDAGGRILGWASSPTAFVKPGEQGVRFDFDLPTAPAAVRVYGGAEPGAYSAGWLYRLGSSEPDPEVSGVGFAQRGRDLTYIFALENPDSEDLETEYVVTAYDRLGRVVGVQNLAILDYLPYGARYGAVDQMKLVTGDVPVERLGVQVRRFGRFGVGLPVPKFDGIRYSATGGNAGEVTAAVTNPDPEGLIVGLRAVAITYDAQGKINGGGSLVLPDLEPGATAEVRIPVVAAGAVATVELLPKVLDEVLFKPDEAKARPPEGPG